MGKRPQSLKHDLLINLLGTLSTFKKPRHTQNQSRLVSLPVELRVKVLRTLLVAGEPILSLAHYAARINTRYKGAEKRYKESVNLSAQIMPTCQDLYVEAKGILYEENTISVNPTTHEFGSIRFRRRRNPVACAMLDAVVGIPDLIEECEPIQDLVKNQEQKDPQQGAKLLKQWREHFLRLYPALEQFRHWRIEFDITFDFLAHFVRTLSKLLLGKRVTIAFHGDLELRVLSLKSARMLGPLKLLRCEHITIQDNFHAPVRHEIETVVESQLPIVDLYKEYAEFRKLLQKLPEQGPDMHQRGWLYSHAGSQLDASMNTAVTRCAATEFEAYKKLALNDAVAWNEKASRLKIEKAEKVLARMKKRMEDVTAELADMAN